VGGLAEHSARQQERAIYRAQTIPAAPAYYIAQSPPAQTAVPATTPVWNPPIKAVNATYYWTAPPAPAAK
jgi:hypothetical protein